MFSLPKYKKLCRVSCRVLEYSHFFSDADCTQLLRQPDAQPYEIVHLPENPLRHLTHCLPVTLVLIELFSLGVTAEALRANID